MRLAYLAILIIFLSSCTTMDHVRMQNRSNLVRLEQGMTKSDVLNLMGTEPIKIVENGLLNPRTIINNPYRTETIKGDDDQFYEIIFYYTDVKSRDGAITDDELTPLILRDGKLFGWGWSFLGQYIPKYHYQIDMR